MPRRPRFALSDFPLHIVQRGCDRQPCFFFDADHRVHSRWLDAFRARIEAMMACATRRGRPGPLGPHASTTPPEKLRV